MSETVINVLTFLNAYAVIRLFFFRRDTNKDGSWKDASRNEHT